MISDNKDDVCIPIQEHSFILSFFSGEIVEIKIRLCDVLCIC